MRITPLPMVLLAALALGAGARTPSAAATAQDREQGPRYVLPEGLTRRPVLPEGIDSAVRRAIAAVTHPGDPHASREGWRVLAGVGVHAAPACVEALEEADWLGRALLVRALGSMDDPRLDPLLVAASGDPAWAVREAAAIGLARSSGTPSLRALVPLLSDPSWRVRDEALEAARRRWLLGAADVQLLRAPLARLGVDTDTDVRRHGWLALADVRHSGARDVLLEALRESADLVDDVEAGNDNPEFPTALRLIQGVAGGWGDDEEVRDTLRSIGSDPRHPLAGHALEAWFRLAGEEAIEDEEALALLVDVYISPHSADPESRFAAERALRDAGSRGAEALLRVIAVPDRPRKMALPDYRNDARYVLELVIRILGDAAPARLASLIGDASVAARTREIATDLARRAFPSAVADTFREVYGRDEGHWGLQCQLLKGIAAGGGEDVRAIVETALESDALPIRRAAAEILGDDPTLRDRRVLLAAISRESEGELLGTLLGILRDDAGDDAAGVLAPFLVDDRVRVRVAAVGAMAGVHSRDAVDLLLSAISKEDGRDSRSGVPAAGAPGPEIDALPGETPEQLEMRRREETANLEEMRYSNRVRMQNSIVTAVRFASGPDAATTLIALLSHDSAEVRQTAAANLVNLADPAVVPDLVQRVDTETSADARRQMLAAIVRAGGPAADQALERWLSGDDEDLRSACLASLESREARAWPEDAILRVVESGEPGSEERFQAIPLLGRRRDDRYTDRLVALLTATASRDERLLAIEALGMSGDPRAVPALAALLPEGDPSAMDTDEVTLAAGAIEALGELRAAEAVPPLSRILDAVMERALSQGAGSRTAAHRQFALLVLRALGRCGGQEALSILARAAFHPGFSRAAELASSDVRIVRRPGRAWSAVIMQPIHRVAEVLVDSLSRFPDRELSAAVDTRLEALGRTAADFAVSEEWLTWMAARFGHVPRSPPYRPRWFTRLRLLEQVLRNAPLDTEADREAHWRLYQHASTVTGDVKVAMEHFRSWRELTTVHDPARASREARKFDCLAAVMEAAHAGGAVLDEGAVQGMAAVITDSRDDDDVASLAAELLRDRGVFLDRAEDFADIAVRSDAAQPHYMRKLGEIRLQRGDLPGALQALRAAWTDTVSPGEEAGRPGTGWTTFFLARALALSGELRASRRLLLHAALANDVVLDWILRDTTLEAVRDDEDFRRDFERIRVEVYEQAPLTER